MLRVMSGGWELNNYGNYGEAVKALAVKGGRERGGREQVWRKPQGVERGWEGEVRGEGGGGDERERKATSNSAPPAPPRAFT